MHVLTGMFEVLPFFPNTMVQAPKEKYKNIHIFYNALHDSTPELLLVYHA
jgi:hypothetical protein